MKLSALIFGAPVMFENISESGVDGSNITLDDVVTVSDAVVDDGFGLAVGDLPRLGDVGAGEAVGVY